MDPPVTSRFTNEQQRTTNPRCSPIFSISSELLSSKSPETDHKITKDPFLNHFQLKQPPITNRTPTQNTTETTSKKATTNPANNQSPNKTPSPSPFTFFSHFSLQVNEPVNFEAYQRKTTNSGEIETQ
ncbi:hypothetical protein KY285_013907 [Solanum tuberosum]|nr:hypothetical protein KY285_013907 [Solanum tuberosum]